MATELKWDSFSPIVHFVPPQGNYTHLKSKQFHQLEGKLTDPPVIVLLEF